MSKKIIALMISLMMCGMAFACATPTNPDVESPSDSSLSGITTDSSDTTDSESTSDSDADSSSDTNEESSSGGDVEKEKITVTFRQNGAEDIVLTVAVGESLTDIPTPIAKVGYIVVWDRTDFSNLAQDIMVQAIETAKTYTVTLKANGGVLEQSSIIVTYGQAYALPTPMHGENIFEYWTYAGEEVAAQGVWEIDGENLSLTAQWNECHWSNNY
ncbi:MAG: InlB B-repeat-containing protein [Clostridia bacterium]|nr:InlB B-repeat-containing protein [Clostridia bacterium]